MWLGLDLTFSNLIWMFELIKDIFQKSSNFGQKSESSPQMMLAPYQKKNSYFLIWKIHIISDIYIWKLFHRLSKTIHSCRKRRYFLNNNEQPEKVRKFLNAYNRLRSALSQWRFHWQQWFPQKLLRKISILQKSRHDRNQRAQH